MDCPVREGKRVDVHDLYSGFVVREILFLCLPHFMYACRALIWLLYLLRRWGRLYARAAKRSVLVRDGHG